MNRGDVVSWPKFPFEDKKAEYGLAPSDKLLVAIGVDRSGVWLMWRTTTKARPDRPDAQGCHSEQSVYRFKENRNKFKDPCWLQYEQPVFKEEREVKNAGGGTIFALTNEEIAAVINCYKKSPELTNWIWEYCR